MAANYRAACRARSRAEFVAKLGTVLEGVDETAFWLELSAESEILRLKRVGVMTEADDLLQSCSPHDAVRGTQILNLNC